MIGIEIEVKGEKILINGLEEFERELPGTIQDGLGDIIDRVHIAAIKWLQGPRRGVKTITSKKGRQRAVPQSPELAGNHPVPRVTGNLLRLLDTVKPGRRKSSNGLSFLAAFFEAILFNSAEYASVISEGTGSSAKYGPRPFGEDALKEVEPEMPAIMNSRINRLVASSGL